MPCRGGGARRSDQPEELLPAAHPSCLAMNLSGVPTGIDVSVEVSPEPAAGEGFEIGRTAPRH